MKVKILFDILIGTIEMKESTQEMLPYADTLASTLPYFCSSFTAKLIKLPVRGGTWWGTGWRPGPEVRKAFPPSENFSNFVESLHPYN